jgi:hypothetical protein
MISHIEVISPAKQADLSSGKLLEVIQETKCYFFARPSKDGMIYKISKKTGRAPSTNQYWLDTSDQPSFNMPD